MNKNHFIKAKILLIFFLGLLSISFASSYSNYNSNPNNKINPNNMIVHFIDVGQGDSILIQVNSKNMLIDSGPKSDKKKLFNYLSRLNLAKLDYVIATHPHEDHIGNMADIITNYDVLEFYAPKVQSNTKSFEMMIDALNSKKLKINVIKKGVNSIDLGKNSKVTVFSPNKNSYEDLNNYSPVIKIEYGITSFIFTGDAQKDVEKELLDSNENISADVLKIGHHGSSTSTSKSFLRKVDPSFAVISVGKDNVYNHPTEKILTILAETKIRTFRTDKDGTILITSDGSKIITSDTSKT